MYYPNCATHGVHSTEEVMFTCEMFFGDSGLRVEERMKEVCSRAHEKYTRQSPMVSLGKVGNHIFPTEKSREASMTIGMNSGADRKFNSILVIALAIYKFDNNFHVTAIPFRLQRKDGSPFLPAKPEDTRSNDGDVYFIKAENLVLAEIWKNYAD